MPALARTIQRDVGNILQAYMKKWRRRQCSAGNMFKDRKQYPNVGDVRNAEGNMLDQRHRSPY